MAYIWKWPGDAGRAGRVANSAIRHPCAAHTNGATGAEVLGSTWARRVLIVRGRGWSFPTDLGDRRGAKPLSDDQYNERIEDHYIEDDLTGGSAPLPGSLSHSMTMMMCTINGRAYRIEGRAKATGRVMRPSTYPALIPLHIFAQGPRPG